MILFIVVVEAYLVGSISKSRIREGWGAKDKDRRFSKISFEKSVLHMVYMFLYLKVRFQASGYPTHWVALKFII